MAGALKGNENAKKWDLDSAKALLLKAIEMSNERENGAYTYDFIGEIARELDSYHMVFTYLSETFEECKSLHEKLKANLEANCFHNTKKGNIREAIGIVNLKSNYKWTDRVDQTGDQTVKIVWNEEKSY